MTDVTVAADAPAAPSAAPIETPSAPDARPVGTDYADIKKEAADRRAAESPPEPKKPATVRDSLKVADAKFKEKHAAAPEPKKADPKPEPKPAPESQPAPDAPEQQQQQAPQQAAPQPAAPTKYQPPARFSEDAKQAWATAPEPVQREVDRAIRELTQGHEKYKADSEAFEPLRQYHEMAKQGGTTLDKAVSTYVETEQLLRRDPIRGLESICENLGLSLKQVSEHYLNRTPEQQQSAKDVEIAQLKQMVQRLEQGFTSFKGDQESREVQQYIAQFKADPKYSRFDDLQSDIGMFLSTGRAQDLAEAYEMAERLNPAPTSQASPPAASSAPVVSLEAQTLKGQKSISGAPSAGSSPAPQQPSSSIREALKRANARAG